MDLGKDRLYSHIKPTKNRTKFLEFCRYLRSLYPPKIRIAIVLDNFSPHLTTKGHPRRRLGRIWRNKHAADERLREVVNRANVA